MNFNQNDKDDLQVLHAVPRNHRDASNNSGKSNLKWSNPPTPIPAPSNSTSSSRLLNGPFQASRTRDTLHRNNNIGNPTSRSTVTRAHRSPPNKKRKTGHEQTFGISGRGMRKPQTRSLRNTPPLAPDKEVVILSSDDNDDDWSQPIASDELNLREAGPSTVRNTNGPLHPFEMSDEDTASSYPRMRKPSDESKMKRPRDEYDEGGLSSPIEDFDEDELAAREPPGKVKVKEMVQNFERLSRVEQLEMRRHPPSRIPESSSVPHIDLATLKPTPNTVNSVKNRMKPKEPSKQIQLPQRDSVATSSSGFISSTRKAFKSGNSEIELPVKQWYLGCNYFDVPYTLKFRRKASEFTIRTTGNSETIRLEKDVSDTQYSVKKEPPYVVQIDTNSDPQMESTLGPNFRHHFEPGHRLKGIILISFDEKHPSWSEDKYKAFCDCLKSHTNSSETRNANGPWDTHFRRCELAASRPRSTSVVVDSEVEETGQDSVNDLGEKPKTTVVYGSGSKRESERSAPQTRRSSRQKEASARTTPQVDPDEVILSYPPATAGSVNITNGDLNRLEPDEYLNDTLIEFGLRLWHRELGETDPDLASQIHIFNSFFYKKLLAKKSVDESYSSVQRWTSKLDLFSKKFIIVPINEAVHWYLAIIYRPGQILLPPPEKPPARVTRKSNANEILPIKDDDEQEVQDVQDVQAALEVDDSSTVEREKSESSKSVDDESHPTGEDDLLKFQSSVSTIYFGNGISRSNSPSSVHMDLTEEAPSHPDAMDVDQDPILFYSRARSVTVSDDDKPTSSTAATIGRSPSSAAHELSMEVDELLNIKDSDRKPDNLSEANMSMNVDALQTPALDKGKGKVTEIPDDDDDDDAIEVIEEQGVAQETMPAYICTLDSLGSKHPKAIKTLTRYLELEAKHRKETPNTSNPTGKLVQVPVQPNFTDCGIYLLHFARTFVRKADYFCQLPPRARPQDERIADWEGDQLVNSRENLRKRILELSKEWKRERAVRDEEKKQQAEKQGQTEIHEIDDSDDEPVFIEAVTHASTSNKKGGRGGKANQERHKPARVR